MLWYYCYKWYLVDFTISEAELGHEEAVSKSLDSALHQTFQGLHRFTRNETDDQNKATVTQSSIIPISTSKNNVMTKIS